MPAWATKVAGLSTSLIVKVPLVLMSLAALVSVRPTVAELSRPLDVLPEHPNEALLKAVGGTRP